MEAIIMRSLRRTATIVGVSVSLLGVSVPVFSQEQGAKPAVHAQSAMASSGHPLVTHAMVDVLKKGGNALDAAMTGAVMQTVIEPQMVTLAGALSLLYYDAKSGTYYYLDAELNHTRKGAPVSAGWVPMTLDPPQIESTSGRTIAVPGMVAGLKAATERFGTLKWADYFAPAIAAAEQGFPMYSFLYGEMADAALGRLAVYPSGRAEFLQKGYVPPVGTIVTRPNLARTMRRLAAGGPDYFYKGEWAQHFVTAARETGGEITLDDLGAYEPRWEEPVRSTYRDFEIIGAPPPSTAGTLIAMILNIVEPWDLKAQPHYSESADTFFRIRRAFAFAEDLTDGYVQDPQSFDVPVKTLLSKDLARSLTALIDGGGPKAHAAGTEPPPVAERLAASVEEMRDPHSTDTDQIVVVDKDGNMISVTHSVCGPTFGTGLVVDGVVVNGGNGFPGKAIGGGVRVVSPFDPTMVAKGGKPLLTIGSPGLSSRAVTLALINYLGYGMTLEQAADAPRWQGAQSYKPVTVEARVSEQVRRELSTRYGVSVRTTTPYNWHFGSIHAIVRQPDGTLLGVADPRRGGEAAGY
jgi:gamma-glutamyltranspeptidase/glutathione hydrolase